MDDYTQPDFATHYKRVTTSITHQCATASIKKPIHNVKDLRPNAAQPLSSVSWQRKLDVFTSGYFVSACLTAAPSVAAKLRLMARFAALAGLGCVQNSFANLSRGLRLGGAYRDRTDDLMLAKQPLSQLS